MHDGSLTTSLQFLNDLCDIVRLSVDSGDEESGLLPSSVYTVVATVGIITGAIKCRGCVADGGCYSGGLGKAGAVVAGEGGAGEDGGVVPGHGVAGAPRCKPGRQSRGARLPAGARGGCRRVCSCALQTRRVLSALCMMLVWRQTK